MQDVLEFMKTRRSIRKFKSDMIDDDTLNKIIEAGTYAANGRNMQSPIIIAVTNKEMRDPYFKDERGNYGKQFRPVLRRTRNTYRSCR